MIPFWNESIVPSHICLENRNFSFSVIFERDANGLIRFNDLCLAKLKVLPPDPEIG